MGQKPLIWIRLIMICYIVPWWPSWLSNQIAFNNSESACCPDAFHRVLSQSDLLFGRRCCLKSFKMAAILDIGTERF